MSAPKKEVVRDQDNKDYRERNKDRIELLRVKRKYGLTDEQFYSLLDHCEVCGSKERLCIDHSHITNKYRGRLCFNCNTALGHVKDNPGTLRLLADYLERKIDA